jgi:hypothetical protein
MSLQPYHVNVDDETIVRDNFWCTIMMNDGREQNVRDDGNICFLKRAT